MDFMKRVEYNKIWPPFRVSASFEGRSYPTFTRGDGVYLFDQEGRRYFDGISSLWTNLVGHGRKEIVEAVTEQLGRLSFAPLSLCDHDSAIELSAKLVEWSPFGHQHCFFGVSGADATEASIKIARQYWKVRGCLQKSTIVCQAGAYHGATYGAFSLGAIPSKQQCYGPMLSDCLQTELGSLNSLRETFEKVNARETIAAVIIDPFSLPVAAEHRQVHWQSVQALCREFEIILVVDEVKSGIGRTGSFCYSAQFGVKPDIVTFAKSLTNGFAPMSVVMTHSEIFQTIHQNGFLSHGSTMGGHPVGCRSALKVLEILARDNLMERALEIGRYLAQQIRIHLQPLAMVGQVIQHGSHFTLDIGTLGNNHALLNSCMERGLFVRVVGKWLVFAPPLISTNDELDQMVSVIKQALGDLASSTDFKRP